MAIERKTCQRTGTKSAKRKFYKDRKQESRYRKDQNHQIAKKIVAKAKTPRCAIGVEDLGGINDRTPVRKLQTVAGRLGVLSAWEIHYLQSALEGITVIPVDPRYTSRMCSECGHCEKENRKTRDLFVCRHCGYEAPADRNGAKNIRLRAWKTGRRWVVSGGLLSGLLTPGVEAGETTYKLRGFSP